MLCFLDLGIIVFFVGKYYFYKRIFNVSRNIFSLYVFMDVFRDEFVA